ncbi:MAG: hypothetical protein Q9202_004890 [Teloschistes flavicans]
MEAISAYENKHKIPRDWVNYAISKSAPNGYWQRLERGEIEIDTGFFKGFNADLRNEQVWIDYHTSFRSSKKKLTDVANPTQLGDHVSFKAEAASTRPTDQDGGSQRPGWPGSIHSPSKESSSHPPTLSKLAKDTTIGDPVSMESEEVAQGRSNLYSSVNGQSTFSSSPSPTQAASTLDSLPPLPDINGESLFWSMMEQSRKPDPYIFPALLRLRKMSPKERPILAALSNTFIFPPNHPYNHLSHPKENDPRSQFDIFIASAEVGMRKPSAEIYKLALGKLDKLDRERGGSGIIAEDCLFLDDIGENLKTARDLGMRTIKVVLGKTWRAVKELEQATELELMDDKTRRSKL